MTAAGSVRIPVTRRTVSIESVIRIVDAQVSFSKSTGGAGGLMRELSSCRYLAVGTPSGTIGSDVACTAR
jgi:hypothetical protein